MNFDATSGCLGEAFTEALAEVSAWLFTEVSTEVIRRRAQETSVHF